MTLQIGFLRGYHAPGDGVVTTDIVMTPIPTVGGVRGAVIFRPGVASSGIYVETWAEVKAAAAQVQGCIDVYVDGSSAAPHVPASAGVTDFQGRAMFFPAREDASGFTTLTIDNGATLKGIFGIEGTLFIECDSRGTPSLDWDYTGAAEPTCFVRRYASIGNAATSTSPCCVVPDGSTLHVDFFDFAGLFPAAASAIFHTATATATIQVQLFNSLTENTGGGALPATWADGLGTSVLTYDSGTIFISVAIPHAGSCAVANILRQSDSHQVVLTFLANTSNVLGAIAGLGNVSNPGTTQVTAEGFGGTGGGGGGQGGAGAPGIGGGGSGGALFGRAAFDFDLTHALNVTIGIGGGSGAPGAAAGGAGGDGFSGRASYCTDATTGFVLCGFPGSEGGQGGGGGALGGASITGNGHVANAGFPSAGGAGSAAATAGGDGSYGATSLVGSLFGPPAPPGVWSGGSGGVSAVGQGGGGGGGGAGPRAAGAGGGASTAGVGGDGTSSTNNLGNGAGGGAGGTTAVDAGGNGGNGGNGWLKLSVTAY